MKRIALTLAFVCSLAGPAQAVTCMLLLREAQRSSTPIAPESAVECVIELAEQRREQERTIGALLRQIETLNLTIDVLQRQQRALLRRLNIRENELR